MKKFELELDDVVFQCSVAKSADERRKGYSGEGNGPKSDECMLFVFPEPGSHRMWMKDTWDPLDIVFLDKGLKILEIAKGEPMEDNLLGESADVAYVLEFPKGTCVKLDIAEGDEFDDIPQKFLEPDDSEEYSLFVLDADGNTQMEIKGGERIFSRKSTKRIVNLALSSEGDSDFKKLGRTILKEILAQDSRGNEHVKGRSKETYKLDK